MISSRGLEVRAGEIVGIGGVDGNGQVEFAEVLAGIRPGDARWTDGQPPAYIPQDRRRDGLALAMTVEDNLLVEGHRLAALRHWLLLIPSRVRAWCRSLISRFDIKVGRPSDLVSSLSGGNQQKIVVARALHAEPRSIVAVNPTRGLDVRAENYVHSRLLAAKESGAAIVLFSTDLDELAKLSDRVLIMSRGELRMGDDLGKLIGGAS
jgi:simple sugar transport system ATP-binding protein